MAEYIDRDKLNKKKKYLLQTQEMPFPKSEYFIKVDDFWSVPTADVIERSEYIELLKENERLREDLDDKSEALNSICRLHQEYVSKIDKAVEA